jgi:hypothetical protein
MEKTLHSKEAMKKAVRKTLGQRMLAVFWSVIVLQVLF